MIFSKHFCHRMMLFHAPSQDVAVVAIGFDDRIVGPHFCNGFHSYGLLASAQVAKATCFCLMVAFGTTLLEAMDEHHRLQRLHQIT